MLLFIYKAVVLRIMLADLVLKYTLKILTLFSITSVYVRLVIFHYYFFFLDWPWGFNSWMWPAGRWDTGAAGPWGTASAGNRQWHGVATSNRSWGNGSGGRVGAAGNSSGASSHGKFTR